VLVCSRRIAAAALVLVLSAGGSGLCAGWAATPEARMACCIDGSSCPMHTSSGEGAQVLVTQAAADGCCGTSDRDDSTPSATTFVPVAGLAPQHGPVVAAVSSEGRRFGPLRALVPLPGSQVPKHLLLSVFLI
jgi:hypothetical protein